MRWISAAMLCGGLSACQGRAPDRAAPPSRTAPPLAGDVAPETATPEERPADPDSPAAAAVLRVLRDVDAGRLEALADFLPEPYLRDVEALVRTAAEKLPDELWTRLRIIVAKGTEVLKKSPPGETADESETALFRERLAAALDPLADEAAWDRTRWRTFDLRSFLKGPASSTFLAWRDLSPANASLLSNTLVRALEAGEDRALLEFQAPHDPEPRPVDFLLLDGKWIPKSLAEGWDDAVRTGKQRLDEWDADRMARLTEQLRPSLMQIESTLDQMLDAERPEELQLGWWQIQSLLLQARQAVVQRGPPPYVEIRLAGDVTDADLTDLLEQLVQTADDPAAAEYVTLPTVTGTVIQLSPVENVAEFLRRLSFATVKSHDATARSVVIERRPKP
jgi:hypothetical protein